MAIHLVANQAMRVRFPLPAHKKSQFVVIFLYLSYNSCSMSKETRSILPFFPEDIIIGDNSLEGKPDWMLELEGKPQAPVEHAIRHFNDPPVEDIETRAAYNRNMLQKNLRGGNGGKPEPYHNSVVTEREMVEARLRAANSGNSIQFELEKVRKKRR